MIINVPAIRKIKNKICCYQPPHYSSTTTAIKAAAVYGPSDTTEQLHYIRYSTAGSEYKLIISL